jgi:hypothetical protein
MFMIAIGKNDTAHCSNHEDTKLFLKKKMKIRIMLKIFEQLFLIFHNNFCTHLNFHRRLLYRV